jgi:NAD(P)H-dependent FMN reductase
MLDSFMDGIKEYGLLSAEKVYLNDIKIENYSFDNRLGPKEDEVEFKELCQKIQNAKALVIATPTYNFLKIPTKC